MKLNNMTLDPKSVVLGTLAGIAIMLSVGAATTDNENKWEYKLVNSVNPSTANTLNSPEKQEAFLNDLGAKGWKFVQSDGGLLYLTRAKR